jgi:hypothetical protein
MRERQFNFKKVQSAGSGEDRQAQVENDDLLGPLGNKTRQLEVAELKDVER